MLKHRPFAFLAAFCLLASPFLSTDAVAETVIKFNLAGMNTGPDVAYSGGELSTVPDGSVGLASQQSTDVSYQGFLGDTLTSISSGASLTLSGVTAQGSAAGGGGLISQMTSGGMFSLFDNANSLLLSGNLGDGVIAGSSTGSSGSFFSTSPVVYTAGSLLPMLQPDSGAITLSFLDVRTGGNPGLVIDNGTLLNFTATANGQLSASAVPEPSVIGMAAIGALVLLRQRRKMAKKAAASV